MRVVADVLRSAGLTEIALVVLPVEEGASADEASRSPGPAVAWDLMALGAGGRDPSGLPLTLVGQPYLESLQDLGGEEEDVKNAPAMPLVTVKEAMVCVGTVGGERCEVEVPGGTDGGVDAAGVREALQARQDANPDQSQMMIWCARDASYRQLIDVLEAAWSGGGGGPEAALFPRAFWATGELREPTGVNLKDLMEAEMKRSD